MNQQTNKKFLDRGAWETGLTWHEIASPYVTVRPSFSSALFERIKRPTCRISDRTSHCEVMINSTRLFSALPFAVLLSAMGFCIP